MYAELEDVLNRAWLKQRLAGTPDRVPDYLETVSALGVPPQPARSAVGRIGGVLAIWAPIKS